MKTQWTALKKIISRNEQQNDIFLSLIDEEGNIVCANANMVRTLHLQNPRQNRTSFFSLLHPEHVATFRSAIFNSRRQENPESAELYLRNGYYHPMKWQVNHLDNAGGHYLCVGHKLIDDERLKKFNKLGEKNYQLIVEGLNEGILFQDTDGEVIAANQKAAEILHSNLERLYQMKNLRNRWNNSWKVKSENGSLVSFAETPFMGAIQTGKMQSGRFNVQLRDGSERFMNFSSQPLFEAGESQPYAVVTNIVDVTQERKLYDEIKERETIIDGFLANTPTLAWMLDEDAKLLLASDSFCKYFGLDQRQVINKNLLELLPRAVGGALHSKHLRVLETGKTIETNEKVNWADGTSFIFHVTIFRVEGANGKKMVGGNAVNMADKYEVEKQLREANERLLLLSKATSDAIWEWDMQSGVIFRNDVLMSMVGYQFENSKGLSWWLRRIHPEDRNRVTDKIKDATDKGQHSWEDKYRFKCADGEYKHIQDRGYVVYENGLPVKMIGCLQDISDIKKLENQLTEEKLERQKEITETIIRVQEKERTRIGYELHDNVNQILATTKLFVEMLKPTTKEEKNAKSKSIEYISMAVEEIRKLSKELVVPQLKNESLVESIRIMVDDIQLSNVIKIRFTHDNDIDLLSPGKKLTLFRIVQEQLKNILKHSGAGNVDIYLQCRNDNAQLIIRDDGSGFDPKQTHRGIGMSNIHERTRFYNGSVDIQTAPDMGCTMTITIPASQ